MLATREGQVKVVVLNFQIREPPDHNELWSGQDLASSGMAKASKLKRDDHHGNVS